MIEFDHLSFSYPEERGPDRRPILHNVSLCIETGEMVLVMGRSGAGKSTWLRCLNGLVPHFYGGAVGGRVRVHGLDPIALGPRRLSQTVGFVFQDPEAQAVVDGVEDELAFALENQGVPAAAMGRRIDLVLQQLEMTHLRRRSLSSLSGGERQRVAIAAVLVLQPQVLVLDEPTSQLDPEAAAEVLDLLARLNREMGLTVILSEHRLERVAQYVDRMLYLPGEGRPLVMGEPRYVLEQVELTPPVVELGKRLGWRPLPLTVDEARTWAASQGLLQDVGVRSVGQMGDVVLQARSLDFTYSGAPALRGLDLTVRQGELLAVMGHNGAGKTTLLKLCMGLLKPERGEVRVLGQDTCRTAVERLARQVGYVPQNPNALLFADTVRDELAFTRRARGLVAERDELLLETLGLSDLQHRYPRDLSVGERQRVALAAILVGDPHLILLDEPTRGLDYEQKASLMTFLKSQKERGRAILVVTHDVELVAQCADRVVLLERGQMVADGPTGEVMQAWPAFGSQISQLSGDARCCTVQDALAMWGRGV